MRFKSYLGKHGILFSKLFILFQVIFVFATFNREFVFYGIDLRYIGAALEVILKTAASGSEAAVCEQQLKGS